MGDISVCEWSSIQYVIKASAVSASACLHSCTAVPRQRGNKRKRKADGAGGGAPAAHARFQDQRAPWAHGSGIRCGGALLRPPGHKACAAGHPIAAYEDAAVRFS